MININIKGKPKPQPRPRAFARGGKARIYNPTSANDWKKCVMESLTEYVGYDSREPIILTLAFRLPRPKSHYGTGKNQHMLKKQAPRKHIKTPDIDNLVKAVMDAITDINLWKDDSQVVGIYASKIWCDNPNNSGLGLTIQETSGNYK